MLPMWMNAYLSRDIRQWGPTMYKKENPTSLITNTKDTWKYHADLLAVDKTIKFSNHVISLILRCLLEVRYTHEFRNFGVYHVVVCIRAQDIIVRKFTPFNGLFSRLLSEEASGI